MTWPRRRGLATRLELGTWTRAHLVELPGAHTFPWLDPAEEAIRAAAGPSA